MTKTPFINAGLATLYIVAIALLMRYGFKPLGDKPDNILAPIVMLSLLTLSVAVMGYLFVYPAFTLYIDGKKKESVKVFLTTVFSFALLVVVYIVLLISRIL